MRSVSRCWLVIMFCACCWAAAAAQCPARPASGTVVQDALSLYSTGGVLNAGLTMGYSVDASGYSHYCYKYQSTAGTIEAPTFRVNPGDQLVLNVVDGIAGDAVSSKSTMHQMSMTAAATTCGDGGNAMLQSTNVHFHGLNVPPICHQDDVIDTLIQPGTAGFGYSIQIPATEPPGLYWYHPHVHGFTEFQVNGGAAGAIVVEGMEKVRPEVTGLTERVFVIRQQYLVPWVPGPYQLSLNYQVAASPSGPSPIIQMTSGEPQFWRVANASLQEFMPLEVWLNGTPQPLELIALDGYPLAATRTVTSILVPPAGRAEFIVQPPPAGATELFMTLPYSTGPTGNPDAQQVLANIVLSSTSVKKQVAPAKTSAAPIARSSLKFAGLSNATPTATRTLYFSEEFAGTNGPIQFYLTVAGQKQQVFQPNEKPVITTKVGAIEDWTIQNRTLETHAFHIHQVHFMLLDVDGQPVTNQDLRDTIEIPYWSGKGAYPSVTVRMDFTDPTIAGTFPFHCHILLHEDLGMMHTILVQP
ncbi:MAG TPA: multicopper oxidase domain-containing protein [Candidatus Deferrimicrobiaceae bacterium]|nr:multicopper oxidase domain-containing protein [Candidatus Deferrimicrobiaceae bacterium]